MKKISVLIPVYNEESYIGEVIRSVLDAPLPDGLERELIVVDDGSSDNTARIVEDLVRQNPQMIKFVRQERNQGKGAAIRRAIELATGDVCIFQDADLEYDPREFPRLLKPILEGEADVVYGTRFVPSEYRRVLFFWHFVGNTFLALLSNMLTNLNLTDMETGYKAVRTTILKSIPLRCNRFGMEPELTAKFAKRQCRIYEVPISYSGRTYDEGKKITWVDGLKALFAILYFAVVDDIYKDSPRRAALSLLARRPHLNSWLAGAIKPWVKQHVLEVGAGLGTMTTKLLPAKSYVAGESDPMNLEFLQNRFATHPFVDVRRMDLTEPADFADLPPIDTVLCVNVLQHIEDDTDALRNAYEVLEPDGKLIVVVPQGRWLYGSLDKALGHCRRYSRAELEEKLKKAGFDLEEVKSFHRSGTIPWFILSKVLRCRSLGKYRTWVYDKLVWLWRLCERCLPVPGLSLIAIGRKGTNGISQ